jgi:hypothetical protein
MGLLAGGLTNGVVSIWDPRNIIDKDKEVTFFSLSFAFPFLLNATKRKMVLLLWLLLQNMLVLLWVLNGIPP